MWRSLFSSSAPLTPRARFELNLPISPAITLFGAAGEVTGSCTLIECAGGRVIVDFGIFQGAVAEEWRNADAPPIDFRFIDAVIVTHAHVDHCGRLGMLPRLGFKGPVICTEPTARLLPRVLRGSATLQATRLIEFREGTAPVARVVDPPPDPLTLDRLRRTVEPPVIYDHQDAEQICSHIEPLAYGVWRDLKPGLRVRLHDASHVIGSASVEVECGVAGTTRARRVLCSGDLGPGSQAVLRPRAAPPPVEVVVMESTNGARRFGAVAEVEQRLGDALGRAAAASSRVLMPTFSVGRAQQLLYRIARLRSRGRLHGLPVYVDSPMAVFASELHQKFPEFLADGLRDEVLRGGAPLHFTELHYLYSRRHSLKMQRTVASAVVLAGSGFCDAGPILHHLAGAIEDPRTEIVLTGHQIDGTLGHGLSEGAKVVQIGERILQVRARRTKLEGLSGHADQSELLEWLGSISPSPEMVILNHGNDRARSAMMPLVTERIGAAVLAPSLAAPIQF